MIAVLIAPVGAIGGEIFGVYKDTLMFILGVNDGIDLQMLVRDNRVCQSNITEDVSGVNGLVDRLILPSLVIPSYQEFSTVQDLMIAPGCQNPRSIRDVP